MSDVDHVAAIRRAANEVGRLHDSDLSLDIIWHLDALAKQLAEVEARAERLREALDEANEETERANRGWAIANMRLEGAGLPLVNLGDMDDDAVYLAAWDNGGYVPTKGD